MFVQAHKNSKQQNLKKIQFYIYLQILNFQKIAHILDTIVVKFL